jgi:CRISPR/Cas system-associated endonuclease Cas1
MHSIATEITSQRAEPLLRESADQRVIIANGYDVRVCVRANQLSITDGIRTGRRTRSVSRADGIRRIILLADTGYTTLEASRWCDQEGILIAHYDRNGHLVMHSGGIQHTDSRITVAQSLACMGVWPELCLETVRVLLTAKLDGQAAIVADVLGNDVIADAITEMRRHLDKAISYAQLTGYEGRAAKLYWQAWTGNVRVLWQSTLNLPEHWLEAFRGRVSGNRRTGKTAGRNRIRMPNSKMESGNRGATDPINAMLNFAYRVAETEAIYACLTYGLNPGIGLQHAIDDGRNPMALDLMEAARPVCDRIVLDILNQDDFNPKWCYESKHGVVRLYPPLTHMISEQTLTTAQTIQPHAANLAYTLRTLTLPKSVTPQVI